MFLSKDALDGDLETLPLARHASTPVNGRPGSAYGGRPSTAGSFGSPTGAAEEGGEEVATPASAENMRAKMMQQRQRLLAKQRAGMTGGANSMVMANKSLPTPEANGPATPSATATGSGMGLGGTGGLASTVRSNDLNLSSPMGGVRPSTAASSTTTPMTVPGLAKQNSGLDTPSNATTALLSHSVSGLSELEGNSGIVMPDVVEKVDKEEEARRRAARAQDLIDRGLDAEFNPQQTLDNTPSFDIATVAPSDMKAFLHAPAPKHAGMIQCRITRDRSGISNRLHPKYMIESDSGVFLMQAQKQMKNKTPNYAIMMSRASGKDAKDSESFLGKLRSDFLGIEWVAYGAGLNPQKLDKQISQPQAMQLVREELVAVQYTSSKWGNAKGPRKMTVVMPLVQPNGERMICRTLNPTTEGLIALQNSNSSQLVDSYQNKSPKWNDKIGAYVLNFNKRVTEASVKNFQLCNSSDPDKVYLQFGRVGKDVFNIDFRHPMSPFQAFAVCLSSFDYKLGCE